MLLAKSANVNQTDQYGNSALIYAVKNKHFQIIQLLLINDANVNHKNKVGESILTQGFNSKNNDIFWLLKKFIEIQNWFITNKKSEIELAIDNILKKSNNIKKIKKDLKRT